MIIRNWTTSQIFFDFWIERAITKDQNMQKWQSIEILSHEINLPA
jgi:hypothetical protein